jgi:hypothetical protein
MKVIKYKSGYKYQTALQHKTMISITGHDAESEFVSLSPEGLLLIRSGYAWDGPTGYVLHAYRQRMMRGSIYHDALYQLMREGVLHREHRKEADDVFLLTILEDQTPSMLAHAAYRLIRTFGMKFTSPTRRKVIHCAPEEAS